MPITTRKSCERGHSSEGWLESYHTFSFAGYHDNTFINFGPLRVINEDRVAPNKGFGAHRHEEMEIFSYILSGSLEHKDSMGNREILERGDVQFTSAGTGMLHSEHNASNSKRAHFLQIWVSPNTNYLKPSYQTKKFTDEEKKGKLRLIISPDGSENSISIHQDLKMYASILEKDEKVTHTFTSGRAGYIHIADTKGHVIINDDVILHAGDGAFITGEHNVVIEGKAKSEFIFFDLKAKR